MLSKQGTSADDFHTYTYPICISRGNPYYITLYDSGYNCWSAGSYIQITVGEITIYHSRLSINISDEDIFSFPLCMSDEVEAVITRHYTTGADEESFAIYQDSLTTGDLMIMSYGSELDTSKTYKYPLCMLKGYSYFMAFYDTGNNGWSDGSYIQITVGEFTLYKGRQSTGNYESDAFVYPSCSSNEIEAAIIRQYGSVGASNESFSVYEGDSPSTDTPSSSPALWYTCYLPLYRRLFSTHSEYLYRCRGGFYLFVSSYSAKAMDPV